MRLIICSWEACMEDDIIMCLNNWGHIVHVKIYDSDDMKENLLFEKELEKSVDAGYDGVISVNYFSAIARVCAKRGVPYISWVFDSPFDVKEPEKTLGFSTNYVFFFDREEYRKYQKMGFETVHHLELAVNTKRLLQITPTEEEQEMYKADVSFVGNMYKTDFDAVLCRLGEYERGYVTAAIDTLLPVYGIDLLGQVFSDEIVASWKSQFKEVKMIREETERTFCNWMRHIVASEITRRERVMLLYLLSRRHIVKLYSSSREELLPNVKYMGTVDTLIGMPKVFKTSKINLNISSKQIATGIPLRVFDVLGSGGFLLTNYQEEIAENFVQDKELVFYESMDDAVQKVDYYLRHEEERLEIATAGRRAVERFSFERQLKKIFQCVYKDKIRNKSKK